MPRALIVGITGQDGLYLAELLASKGYEVFGLVHGMGNPRAALVEQAVPSARLLAGDVTDVPSVIRALSAAAPDELYNLGGISSVAQSWENAQRTSEVNALGVLNLLEAIRLQQDDTGEAIRFYQASSSEMFGRVLEVPQRETTPFHPRSPYGVAKAYAHYMTINYRESYGIHASTGILFNHESPRRDPGFVTRKITQAVARISLGLQQELVLGNLDVHRDWGFAGDYVEAMWRMLQQPAGDDYIVATGRAHSIQDFISAAFTAVGIEDWAPYVSQSEQFFRPADVELVVGDASKARERLGWEPKVDFEQLVVMMVESDLAALSVAR